MSPRLSFLVISLIGVVLGCQAAPESGDAQQHGIAVESVVPQDGGTAVTDAERPMLLLPVSQRQGLAFQSLVADATTEYVRVHRASPRDCQQLSDEGWLFFWPGASGELEQVLAAANTHLANVATGALAEAKRSDARWFDENELASSRNKISQHWRPDIHLGIADTGYFFRSPDRTDRQLSAFRRQLQSLLIYWGYVSDVPPAHLDSILETYHLERTGNSWREALDERFAQDGIRPWRAEFGWNPAVGALRISLDPGLDVPLHQEVRAVGNSRSRQTEFQGPASIRVDDDIQPWGEICLTPQPTLQQSSTFIEAASGRAGSTD